MSKMAIVYWSGTGNTQEMAKLISEGAVRGGAEISLFTPSQFSQADLDSYDKVAFGCPSMGDEVLEEYEFEPMFAALEPSLKGKSIALFGSYGWGDGQWMRDWQARCLAADANLYQGEGLIVNETPAGDDRTRCVDFGKGFAQA